MYWGGLWVGADCEKHKQDWMHQSAELRFLTPCTPSSTAANLNAAETGTDLDTEGKTFILWYLSNFL